MIINLRGSWNGLTSSANWWLYRQLKSGEITGEFTYPRGRNFKSSRMQQTICFKKYCLALRQHKGIDQRAIDLLQQKKFLLETMLTEIFAASIVLDSVVRLIPGVISNESSALFDSFQDNLLAHPIYSRPALYKTYSSRCITFRRY